MSNQRIKAFDSLRGIGCLIVFFAHIISIHPQYGMYVNGCGKIGVWCFFILSGFLTFLPYAFDENVKIEKPLSFVLNYYKKKLFKLYPIYLIALLGAWGLGMFTEGTAVIKHLLCVSGEYHFWYMPVVIKFYLVAPWLILLYARIKETVFWVFMLVVGVVFAIAFPFTNYGENSISLYWYVPVFVMGCLLSFIYKRVQVSKSKIWHALTVSAVIVIVLLTPYMRELMWGMEPTRWLQNKYLFFGILWSIIILGVLLDEGIRIGLEKIKLLQFFGKISYEMYLIHFLLLWKLIPYIPSVLWMGVIVGGGSVLISVCLNGVSKRVLK